MLVAAENWAQNGPDSGPPAAKPRTQCSRPASASTPPAPSRPQSVPDKQIAEHIREAGRYDALGQPDAAQRLRRQAHILAAYVQ